MLVKNEKLSSLENLINLVNSNFRDNQQRDRGTTFEYISLAYFKNEPKYSRYFDNVWLLSDVPNEYGISKKDQGVDLVGRKRHSGELVAIQAKYYSQDSKINKSDIDSFLNEVGKNYYSEGIIVSSTDQWSSAAEEALNDRDKEITRIGFTELKNSKIDWSQFYIDQGVNRTRIETKKTPRAHQQEAIKATLEGFENHDRGKLVMAPGTGKTYTSLQIAEELAIKKQEQSNKPFVVLYLVPSIQLLSQSLTGWTSDTKLKMDTFAVTSDRQATRKTKNNADIDITVADIGFPATTNKDDLLDNQRYLENSEDQAEIITVFSTYHSIQVIGDAQKEGFYEFDLIVADEAHRTTGATKEGSEESHFVKVHSNSNVKADKRLYQTATPRVYGEKAIQKAVEESVVIADMNDIKTYGPEFFRLGFGEAVHRGILSDYKVMILAVDENETSKEIPATLGDLETETQFQNVMKIIGVWNGLLKRKSNSNEVIGKPMKRAIAFTGTINQSKYITNMFDKVINEYLDSDSYNAFTVDIDHADGSMNALEKNTKIEWLKSEVPDGESRILSNARFLTEGVDVPDLDAVLFMQPRKSTIDIAQAVGRVMRTSPNKEYGYVILPITVSSSEDPETVLNNNEAYEVVWDVLNALRSIDERFDATVNKLELNKKKPDQIEVVGVGNAPAVDEDTEEYVVSEDYEQIELNLEEQDWSELESIIYAQIVEKVGNARYWETWSKDVTDIAQRHINRINSLLADDKNVEVSETFNQFISGLRKNINNSITVSETVEMLAQHLVTKPVFDSLFEEESFALNNPISQAMSKMIEVLEEYGFNREQDELAGFYESVRLRAEGIDNLEAKQTIIIQLYEKFFKVGFPNTTDRLGIVFTPTEIVDFIIQSVEDVLQKHLGTSMNNTNVNILDPFTGTGTFVTRLLQSGIISKENLLYKYTNEIYANEIVLLSYYIAAINIEETFKELSNLDYKAFPGIVLTDTFESTEHQLTLDDSIFSDNNNRLKRQQKAPITVIMGNPPYSGRQKSQNDENENEVHAKLNKRIEQTYLSDTAATASHSVYDSYIKAIRWATDRLSNENGVIGFITQNSYIDNHSLDGVRKTLYKEFNHIYILNLKGGIRAKSKKHIEEIEGGNVFNILSGVAIMVLVKDGTTEHSLNYYNIGDGLSRNDKLTKISELKSIKNISFEEITPDEYGDWINQKNIDFYNFIPLYEKNEESLFQFKQLGINTKRDYWVYGFSKSNTLNNSEQMIIEYNRNIKRREQNMDPTKISWSAELTRKFKKKELITFDSNNLVLSLYRPFTKKYLYNSKDVIARPGSWDDNFSAENLVILTPGKSNRKEFSTLITNLIPDQNLMDAGANGYLKYTYDPEGLVPQNINLNEAVLQKLGLTIDEAIYYIYGILHSNEFKVLYRNNLNKDFARIPHVKNKEEFINIGKVLADLHLNYESVEPYKDIKIEYTNQDRESVSYKVNRMNIPWKRENSKYVLDEKGKKIRDKSTIIFNEDITIKNIPTKAYEYTINGRSAIEWIIDQYRVTTNKSSGLTDNPNEYSDNPKYIFNLLLSIINVSVQTVDLVNSLPPLEILEI